MNIQLGKTNSPREALDKSFSVSASIDGTLKEGSNVVNPSILVSVTNPSNYNYMYIPEFGRYYYITEMTNVRTGLWEIMGHTDVLMTYRSSIRGSVGVIARNGNDYNLYIKDPAVQLSQKTQIVQKAFSPSGFNSSSYVLTISGGKGSSN